MRCAIRYFAATSILASGNLAVAAPLPAPLLPHGRGQPMLRPADPALRFAGTPGVALPWQILKAALPLHPGAMLLLTDGSVMVQDQGPNNGGSNGWWKLTPDNTGSYVNGAWTQLASMQANYGPMYFATAVLPDGRVIVEGGEYNFGSAAWTNRGSIYDPLANRWTVVAPPPGANWSLIGDAPGAVLGRGQFMLGSSGVSGKTAQALLNAKTLKWTTTGAGKADGNEEEGWSLLPDGNLLTVDASNGLNTELYSATTGAWTSAGNVPASMVNGGEVGPQLLRYDGTVFAEGAGSANAIYTLATGRWTAAPKTPVVAHAQLDAADAASALLPSGDVLLDVSPGVYQAPTHFFTFNAKGFTQVADAANATTYSSYAGYMLVLPTGQVLFNDRSGTMSVYTETKPPLPSARPAITAVPTTLSRGVRYAVSGRQLGGLSQGSAYGDDFQDATDYPLVRLTNTASGHVFYGRSAGFSLISVARNAHSSANFIVPATVETGPATLVVVANGIASVAVAVTVN